MKRVLLAALCLSAGCASVSKPVLSGQSSGQKNAPPRVLEIVSKDGPTIARFAGKPTAIFFWSSWCRVCITELPRIQRLADALRASAVQVRSVVLMDELAAAERAMAQTEFFVPTVLDVEGRISKQLGIHSLPAMVFIDARGAVAPMLDPQDGTLRSRIEGPREWDSPRIVTYLNSTAAARVTGRADLAN